MSKNRCFSQRIEPENRENNLKTPTISSLSAKVEVGGSGVRLVADMSAKVFFSACFLTVDVSRPLEARSVADRIFTFT